MKKYPKFSRLLSRLMIVAAMASVPVAAAAEGQDESWTKYFLRGGYQLGPVLQTNDFLKGANNTGQPIDFHQSLRLEFGWRTDGTKDWHHLYNFPSFGVGLYGANFDDSEELGNPTSFYGFFSWPFSRTDRWRFSTDIGFGLTGDWNAYDPVNNPNNIALGLGRSVHIEIGVNAAFRLSRRWSLVGGVSAVHFSNGGTQRPNHGLNVAGPRIYIQHDTGEVISAPVPRATAPYDPAWSLTITGSAGKRNLNLEFSDPSLRDDYLNRNYLIMNFTFVVGRKFSHKSRYCFGLDAAYDQSVGDLIELNAFNQGYNEQGDFGDDLELAVIGGYELIANNTRLLLQLGYKVLRKDVPGRLPDFYQRLGLKQFIVDDFFVGMNVRFHELGSADNLEWNLGYDFKL